VSTITVKNLVEFRKLSDKRRSTFAANLKKPLAQIKEDDSGGDYWVRSISGISKAYKFNEPTYIQEKIDDVSSVYNSTIRDQTKKMYKRNLEILQDYTNFDFSMWRPHGELEFMSKPNALLNIKKLPIRVIPHHVFSFEHGSEKRVGAIWFVAQLTGYDSGDLGIFTDALYRYLHTFFSTDYLVDTQYCLTVNTSTQQAVCYQDLLDGKAPALLESTIDTLNTYL